MGDLNDIAISGRLKVNENCELITKMRSKLKFNKWKFYSFILINNRIR